MKRASMRGVSTLSRLLLTMLLVVIETWVAFEVIQFLFQAIGPHFSGIDDLFSSRRDRGGIVVSIISIAIALGIPVLLAGVSGYALCRMEFSSERKRLDKRIVERAGFVFLGILFAAGIMIVAGRGNVDFQIYGGIAMLFGVISLFTLGWASYFFRK